MPRRKRTPEESGRRTKISRVEQNEETLVISDSEQEEEDSSVKRSTRTDRCRRREINSQLQEMTEDEMLDLAMRLSAQEASSAAQRQRQLEDSDIQKAIAESLNESAVQGSEGKDEAADSSCPPQQNVRLRRKLSYPSPDQTNPEKERETTSPLPEIPDLSQVASSHLSSRCSAWVSRTPTNTQDRTSDKQTVISDTPEDERFKSGSESQSSPAITRLGSFIRRPVVCVEKLSQELILSSAASVNIHTEDGTVTSTCTDGFRSPEQDSPASKWQVFTQNVFKRTSGQLKDKDGHQNANGNEDDTQIPDEDTGTPLPTQLSQGLSTCTDSCISPSRRSQISSPKCIPEDHKDVTEASKTPDQKKAADQATQDDDADDEDDGSEEVLFPSPVKKIVRPIMTELSPNRSCISSATITLDPSSQDTQMSRSVLEEVSRASKGAESQLSDRKPPHTSVEKGQRTISYYWGVPFCPMGLNPDEYTRVIMCQLEVYEKSLKEAQRKLLRKADWGQPVLPGSSERLFGWRRLKRNRAPQLSEDEDENEGEKGNNRKEVEEEREEARQEPVVGSQEEAEGGQSETYIVVSSPETKDEQVEKNPFFSQEEPVTADANQSLRKNTPWDISDEAQIKCPAEQEEQEAQTHEGCEEDEIICPETQMTENGIPEQMMTSPASPAQTSSHADSELMEVEEGGGGASVAAEEMMEQESDPAEAASLHTHRVECPICSKLFPNNRIELHAAYCDGVADQQEEPSHVVARRKRTRRNLTDHSQRSAKSAEMEKCSLCQEMFSPQEYPEHVNLCFKKKDLRTNQENGLLSALERIERRHTGSDEPGPSEVSAKSNCGLAVPAVMGSGDCAATTSCLTEAFTPRSENTDCLIDPSKNSQRLSRKRKFKK